MFPPCAWDSLPLDREKVDQEGVQEPVGQLRRFGAAGGPRDRFGGRATRGTFRLALSVVFISSFLFVVAVRADAHEGIHAQIAEVTRRIEASPRDARLRLRRGELHRQHRAWSLAFADFARAIELDPRLPGVSLARAQTLRDAGRPDKALAAIDAELARRPRHGPALLERARSLHALRRHSEAADAYTRAFARLGTVRPDDYLARARALAVAGRRGEAVRSLDEGIAKLGPVLPLHLLALDLEIAQRHYDAALARLDAIMAEARRKEKWLARRGEVLLAAGRPEQALAEFAWALAAIDALPARHRRAPAVLQIRAGIERHIRKEDR